MGENEDLDILIRELAELKSKHFDPAVDWYQRHARMPRRMFNFILFSAILFSVSIPFLASVKFRGSGVLLSAVALLTALVTGVNASFRPDYRWRGYKQAQFVLEHLESLWDLSILEARRANNIEEGKKIAIDATRTLLRDASDIRAKETEGFFQNVKLPEASRKA